MVDEHLLAGTAAHLHPIGVDACICASIGMVLHPDGEHTMVVTPRCGHQAPLGVEDIHAFIPDAFHHDVVSHHPDGHIGFLFLLMLVGVVDGDTVTATGTVEAAAGLGDVRHGDWQRRVDNRNE